MQLPYLETLNCLTIGFHYAKDKLQSKNQLRLPRDTQISNLANALKLELDDEFIDCDMRVMQLHSSKVFKVLDVECFLELFCEGD